MPQKKAVKFEKGVSGRLKNYVYLLTDDKDCPFYVGEGKDGRIFEHQELEKESGGTVKHVVLRHGLSKKTAIEIEAALIDAFGFIKCLPDLKNEQRGHGSRERGLKTVAALNAMYGRSVKFRPCDRGKILAVNVRENYKGPLDYDKEKWKEIYKAARFAWRVSKKRIDSVKYVLAVREGVCIEVFQVLGEWLPATPENFPDFFSDTTEKGKENQKQKAKLSKKWGFEGKIAPASAGDRIRQHYRLMKLRDDPWGEPGVQNPLSYCLAATKNK